MPATPVDLAAVLALADGPAALDTRLGESTFPLALFPVRLETRFVTTAAGASELWVRVYPDKVHIDSHDPRLSADETLWGKQFWTATWQAGSDDTARRTAWQQTRDPVRCRARRLGGARFDPDGPTGPSSALRLDGNAGVSRPRCAGHHHEDASRPFVAHALGRYGICRRGDHSGRHRQRHHLRTRGRAGPEQGAAPESIPDDELAVDDGLKWMIDFDIAQQVGMGLRLPLPAPSVDLLVVTGARDGDASTEVAAQFDAHHYSDGLAFVPRETPTNNTDLGRSGLGGLDTEQRRSYDSEWVLQPGDGSAARLATTAFGVRTFDQIGSAADQDDVAARAMMTALWPATWGYYLSQMVGFDGPFAPAARDWARTHALAYLRPSGPLPVVRCGTQPYGLLPVTALDHWTAQPDSADAAEANGLRALLASMRDAFWRPVIGTIARVGRTDDAGADLIDVLQSAAMTSSWGARRMMGQHFLQHLRAFLGEDLDALGFWQRLVELGSAAAQQAQLGFVPAIAHAAYEESAHALGVPLVGDANYLSDLATAAAGPVAGMLAPREPGAPLLKVLLRHAFLRQLADDVARTLDTADTPLAQLVRDAELNDLVPSSTPTPTWSWQRARPINGHTAADEVVAHPGSELTEFRSALNALAGEDPATLERHLVSTLDAASHRLDAWTTSLATRRLAELRVTNATGISVGGYAWIENLRPAADRAAAPPTQDEPAPLFVDTDDPGFIQLRRR